MNCDQVFDILTRGPFPTGTSCDAPVEAHLNVCSGCRRLAEALRPAVELFQEAIGPEESRDLPGYWSAVTSERAVPVASCDQDVKSRARLRRFSSAQALKQRWSNLAAWQLAAMLALGMTLGLLVGMRGDLDRFGPFPPRTTGATLVSPGNDETPRLTSAQKKELAVLPAACTSFKPDTAERYARSDRRVLAEANLASLSCCTECHNKNSDRKPGAVVQVTQACQLCH